MAETDFVPIYGQADPGLRPSLVARQGMAGYRAPGFIGRALAGAQPNAAPQVGATSSGDGAAALRGLYAARASDDLGVGNAEGAIQGGQQPTREAQSFNDWAASSALGLLGLTGPAGFGAVMNTADRMGRERNLNGPVGWGDVRSAINPFSAGNSTIGRAAGAAYDSVFGGGGRDTGAFQGPNYDGSTLDQSYQGPNPDGSVVSGASQGPNADGSTVDMGPQQGPTESGATVDAGGAGAGSNSDPGPSPGDPTGGQGPEHLRTGGPVGKPGSKPMPRPIVAHTGEFVHRPEAVNKYGPSAMHAINSMRAPAAAVKKATGTAGGPPAKGKAPPPKKGGGMDALAKLKASR